MTTSNSKLHSITDYTISFLYFISPWLFGFEEFGVPSGVIMISGACMLAMSLFTKYDYSLYKIFDLETHRNVALMFGIFVAVSPWLLRFKYYTSLPHLLLGITLILAALAGSPGRYNSEYSRTVH